METTKDVINTLAKAYGSVSALAKLLGVTAQAVFNWRTRGAIPLKYNSELLSLARQKDIMLSRSFLEGLYLEGR